MEENLIEGIKHMKLTIEEEIQIAVSREGRTELIEECALSLVGRLMSERWQNQRALKNTAIGMENRFRSKDYGCWER